MNRKEFMERLEWLLGDFPEEEKQEALRYYQDYFDDAGPEKEAEVIAELGSPEQVACMMRMNQKEQAEYGEYTERGFQDERFRDKSAQLDRYGGRESGWKEGGESEKEPRKQKRSGPGAGMIVLLIVTSPVWGALLIAVLACLVGIACAVLGLGIGLAAGIIGCFFGGIAALIAGAANLFLSPGWSLICLGTGLALLGIGLAAVLLCKIVFAKVLPLCFTAAGNLLRFLFRRNRKEEAGR